MIVVKEPKLHAVSGWKVVQEMAWYSFDLLAFRVSALSIEYFVKKELCLRKL